MRRAWLWLLLFALPAAAQEKLSVAAAANLVYALSSLTSEFRKLEPAIEVTVVTAASGSLVAQIQNGAPFDIFLSADRDYPEKLVALGFADANSLTTFAVGRLVLWTMRPQLEVSSVQAALRDGSVKRLAIANPQTAPYGRAAREALGQLGLWPAAQARIVMGENITQTAQFVETAHADAGFVALSLVLSPRLQGKGRWTEIPADLYSPLEQGAVITRHGSGNPAAARYLTFLRGPEARAVLERFGYRVPNP